MHPRHRVIPLLVALLVIQGMVAMVPHEHGPTVAVSSLLEGGCEALAALAAGHSPGRCFACSVHAPVVAPGTEVDPAWTPGQHPPASARRQRPESLSEVGGAGPRGPPCGF